MSFYDEMQRAARVAEEFIDRAEECRDHADWRYQQALKNKEVVYSHDYYTSPKNTGAVRRQSMELTRALAKMRRTRQRGEPGV